MTTLRASWAGVRGTAGKRPGESGVAHDERVRNGSSKSLRPL